MRKIQSGDKVQVITGKFRGTVSTIEAVDTEKNSVYVKGVNVVKRAVKGRGFVEKTLPVHVSNVMIYCEKCKKPVRVSIVEENGKKFRACKKCGTKIKK